MALVCFGLISWSLHQRELVTGFQGSVGQTVGVKLGDRSTRLRGAAVGFAGVALVTGLCLSLGRDLSHAVPALMLLVPVVLTTVMTDRWVALPVAAVAAFVFALAFIPPIGQVQIGLTEDVFVLVAFVVVSLTIGTFSGGLRTQANDAELLDQQRAVLLRGVSHDLRSPLSTIRSISTELLDSDLEYDADTRDELLGRVRDESERLDRIVGNLLSVSRVQAGALIPTLEPESIGQLARHSVARLHAVDTHTITVDVPTSLPDVLVDSVQIDQVLTNLIENALRHTPPGSRIALTAHPADDRVRVTVADNGPGFAADGADRFQPFQGSGGASVGLGLAVCKAIVEAHGGTISVRDEPSGGAAVSFTVAVYQHPAADSAG